MIIPPPAASVHGSCIPERKRQTQNGENGKTMEPDRTTLRFSTNLAALRGIAAAMVVIFHALMVFRLTGFDEPHRQALGAVDTLWEWLVIILLGLTNGHAAVIIFFVLSGVVLIVGSSERIHQIERLFETSGEQCLIAAFNLRTDQGGGGAESVSQQTSQNITDSQREDMMLATSMTRLFGPDDVVIALPLQEPALINWCVGRLVTVPAAIHVALNELSLEAFLIPARASLKDHLIQVSAKPMPLFSSLCKRAFDILGATIGLIVLSPLMLLIALAIKFDSRGPVPLTQTRYGFNLVGFRILKFRTMHTLKDGRHVRQAVADDTRITRVGGFLRRWNLDELPQIMKVLIGTMSLVGPHPHGMAHDQEYFQTVALYARRHNVKPGITGWAQVNGYRGEIIDEEALTNRLAHYLDYIVHWEPWFDIKIIFLTVFSANAYRNAK